MEVHSIETIFKALNDARVKYLVVGGLAVNVHGYERLTVDVDLVISLQPENIKGALRALEAVGYQMSIPATPEEFARPELRESWRKEKNMLVLRLWSDAHRRTPIDVFVYEPFDFEKEFAQAKWERVIGDIRAPVIRYETLLAMKTQAGRDKDLMDIRALKKLDPYR
jgi:predicted nucleotidyltransferase